MSFKMATSRDDPASSKVYLGVFCSLFMSLSPLAAARLVTRDTDYCAEFGSNNTMCLYSGPSDTCQFVNGAPTISQTTIDEILLTHNTLRAKVANGQQEGQPPASDMEELIWNDGLAVMAQRWADQCDFDHDLNRLIPAFPTAVGQNIAADDWGTGDMQALPMDFKGAIQGWYDEVVNYTAGANNVLVWSEATGHYTQVVWANTYAVGCGFSMYTTESGDESHNYYVCNYGPGGNFDNEPVYKVGDAATECGSLGTSSDYPGLCNPTTP